MKWNAREYLCACVNAIKLLLLLLFLFLAPYIIVQLQCKRDVWLKHEALTELHFLVRRDILGLFLVFWFIWVKHFSGPLIIVWLEKLEVYMYLDINIYHILAGIHIFFFSPSRQPGKYVRWHTCPGKILLARSIGKNCNRTPCKCRFYFFLWISHNQSSSTHTAVHHVHSCGCQQTQKIQVQMKTKASLTAMKAERNTFALPARICFPKCKHYYLMPYPDQNSW